MPTFPSVPVDQIVADFLKTYTPVLGGLVGLILLDLLSGIASAVKRGVFNWDAVARFYATSVLPGLIGWFALALTSYLVAPGLFGDATGDVVSPTIALSTLTTVVVVLVRSIRSNLSEALGPAPAKVQPPA